MSFLMPRDEDATPSPNTNLQHLALVGGNPGNRVVGLELQSVASRHIVVSHKSQST